MLVLRQRLAQNSKPALHRFHVAGTPIQKFRQIAKRGAGRAGHRLWKDFATRAARVEFCATPCSIARRGRRIAAHSAARWAEVCLMVSISFRLPKAVADPAWS